MKIIHSFTNQDTLQQTDTAIIACFTGRRKVLSTAAYNGGYREDLKWVFNQDYKHDYKSLDNPENGRKSDPDFHGMKAPTFSEHMRIVAFDLGLDPSRSCGLTTAADMDNVSIQSMSYADTTVTAVVTGGIDVNGGRAGDRAEWHETLGSFVFAPGTINILLFIDADLTESALAQAMVTSAEAKAAATQELLAPSRYSTGIATGSGTDGIIIISDSESPVKLTSAGKHCKLGELIGRTVIAAVKEALFLQTQLGAAQQFSILRRMDRFHVTEASIWESIPQGGLSYPDFCAYLHGIASEPTLVVLTSLYAHLLDQLQWGLLDTHNVFISVKSLLEQMGMDSDTLTENQDHEKMIVIMVKVYEKGIGKLACI